ncbi:unnamed protein product [Gordionus sp. m RMFG-2023]
MAGNSKLRSTRFSKNKTSLNNNEQEQYCAICLDLIYKPVTFPCGHALCLNCFEKAIEENISFCPSCRKSHISWIRRYTIDNEFIGKKKVKYPQYKKNIQNKTPKCPHRKTNPGEIGNEYKQEVYKIQTEYKEKQQLEELQSYEMIQQILAEDAIIFKKNKRFILKNETKNSTKPYLVILPAADTNSKNELFDTAYVNEKVAKDPLKGLNTFHLSEEMNNEGVRRLIPNEKWYADNVAKEKALIPSKITANKITEKRYGLLSENNLVTTKYKRVYQNVDNISKGRRNGSNNLLKDMNNRYKHRKFASNTQFNSKVRKNFNKRKKSKNHKKHRKKKKYRWNSKANIVEYTPQNIYYYMVPMVSYPFQYITQLMTTPCTTNLVATPCIPNLVATTCTTNLVAHVGNSSKYQATSTNFSHSSFENLIEDNEDTINQTDNIRLLINKENIASFLVQLGHLLTGEINILKNATNLFGIKSHNGTNLQNYGIFKNFYDKRELIHALLIENKAMIEELLKLEKDNYSQERIDKLYNKYKKRLKWKRKLRKLAKEKSHIIKKIRFIEKLKNRNDLANENIKELLDDDYRSDLKRLLSVNLGNDDKETSINQHNISFSRKKIKVIESIGNSNSVTISNEDSAFSNLYTRFLYTTTTMKRFTQSIFPEWIHIYNQQLFSPSPGSFIVDDDAKLNQNNGLDNKPEFPELGKKKRIKYVNIRDINSVSISKSPLKSVDKIPFKNILHKSSKLFDKKRNTHAIRLKKRDQYIGDNSYNLRKIEPDGIDDDPILVDSNNLAGIHTVFTEPFFHKWNRHPKEDVKNRERGEIDKIDDSLVLVRELVTNPFRNTLDIINKKDIRAEEFKQIALLKESIRKLENKLKNSNVKAMALRTADNINDNLFEPSAGNRGPMIKSIHEENKITPSNLSNIFYPPNSNVYLTAWSLENSKSYTSPFKLNNDAYRLKTLQISPPSFYTNKIWNSYPEVTSFEGYSNIPIYGDRTISAKLPDIIKDSRLAGPIIVPSKEPSFSNTNEGKYFTIPTIIHKIQTTSNSSPPNIQTKLNVTISKYSINDFKPDYEKVTKENITDNISSLQLAKSASEKQRFFREMGIDLSDLFVDLAEYFKNNFTAKNIVNYKTLNEKVFYNKLNSSQNPFNLASPIPSPLKYINQARNIIQVLKNPLKTGIKSYLHSDIVKGSHFMNMRDDDIHHKNENGLNLNGDFFKNEMNNQQGLSSGIISDYIHTTTLKEPSLNYMSQKYSIPHMNHYIQLPNGNNSFGNYADQVKPFYYNQQSYNFTNLAYQQIPNVITVQQMRPIFNERDYMAKLTIIPSGKEIKESTNSMFAYPQESTLKMYNNHLLFEDSSPSLSICVQLPLSPMDLLKLDKTLNNSSNYDNAINTDKLLKEPFLTRSDIRRILYALASAELTSKKLQENEILEPEFDRKEEKVILSKIEPPLDQRLMAESNKGHFIDLENKGILDPPLSSYDADLNLLDTILRANRSDLNPHPSTVETKVHFWTSRDGKGYSTKNHKHHRHHKTKFRIKRLSRGNRFKRYTEPEICLKYSSVIKYRDCIGEELLGKIFRAKMAGDSMMSDDIVTTTPLESWINVDDLTRILMCFVKFTPSEYHNDKAKTLTPRTIPYRISHPIRDLDRIKRNKGHHKKGRNMKRLRKSVVAFHKYGDPNKSMLPGERESSASDISKRIQTIKYPIESEIKQLEKTPFVTKSIEDLYEQALLVWKNSKNLESESELHSTKSSISNLIQKEKETANSFIYQEANETTKLFTTITVNQNDNWFKVIAGKLIAKFESLRATPLLSESVDKIHIPTLLPNQFLTSPNLKKIDKFESISMYNNYVDYSQPNKTVRAGMIEGMPQNLSDFMTKNNNYTKHNNLYTAKISNSSNVKVSIATHNIMENKEIEDFATFSTKQFSSDSTIKRYLYNRKRYKYMRNFPDESTFANPISINNIQSHNKTGFRYGLNFDITNIYITRKSKDPIKQIEIDNTTNINSDRIFDKKQDTDSVIRNITAGNSDLKFESADLDFLEKTKPIENDQIFSVKHKIRAHESIGSSLNSVIDRNDRFNLLDPNNLDDSKRLSSPENKELNHNLDKTNEETVNAMIRSNTKVNTLGGMEMFLEEPVTHIFKADNHVPQIEWSEWTQWSICSVSCGTGTQVRERFCRGPIQNCGGPMRDVRACKPYLETDPNSPCNKTRSIPR